MPIIQALTAIALWSTLASLTALAGRIPPFQLAAMTFAIGALAGLAGAWATSQPLSGIVRVPVAVLALGVAGLLGYHALYFYALQTAPTIEANVINYLWPLLIVLFSGLLPSHAGGRRLSVWHIAGAVLGFGGALLAMMPSAALPGAGSVGPGLAPGPGHVAALAAAVVWAAYSVASRLFKEVPSTSVVATSALTAIGALAIHLALETTHWPETTTQWMLLAAMGLGPVGLAFTLWDSAVKRGDIRLIGVLSYATPLLSNALLAALGLGAAGPLLWLAVVLVTGGAILAARDR